MVYQGQIFSIVLKDFLTFTDITVYPEYNLNIITGPNGSGKSSIVSAIVLGMGGDPKILSRSNKIADFVKNKQTEATIQITLFKEHENMICFERKINKSGKSEFKIDNKHVPLKEYVSQVKSFNIQIDNLCQFLPQDRVQDFAKMNPQEILIKTQESVCSSDKVKQFFKLKELRCARLNGESNLNKNKDKLKDAESRLAELQKEVDKINEKSKTEDDLKICQIKKSWIEIEDISNLLVAVKNDLSEANKFVERDEKIYQTIKDRSSGLLTDVELLTKNEKDEQNKVREYDQQLDELMEKHLNYTSQIRILQNQLEQKEIDERKRDQELLKLNQLMSVEEKDLNNTLKEYGSEETRILKIKALDEKLYTSKNEVKQIMMRIAKINKDLDNDFTPEIQRYKRSIDILENVAEQKMSYLRDKFSNVYNAVIWLRNNKNKFTGKIYEPMILELNVTNPANAKYFENTIANRDLLAFTCTNKKDMSNLLQYLCTEKKMKINILHSEEDDNCSFKSNSVEMFRRFGFHSFLLDLIDGPPPILNYLCKIYHIHNILIGTEEANQYTDHVPNDIRIYYAGNNRYSISLSRYSGEFSSMRNSIVSTNMLSMSTNKVELEKLKSILNQKLKQSDILKNERSQFEAKVNHLEIERNNIQSARKEFETIKLKIDRHKENLKGVVRKIDRIKNDTFDINKERATFKQNAKATVQKLFNIIQTQEKCLSKIQKAFESQNYFATKLNILKIENSDIENEIKNAKSKLNHSQRLQQQINLSINEKKNVFKTKLNATKSLCQNKSPTDKEFPFINEFRNLPNNMDAIDKLIDDLQARLDCMTTGNQDILEEFECRKSYIASIQEMLSSESKNHKTLDKEIEVTHKEWYPGFMEYLEAIRTKFSQFMRLMGYTGDIRLCRNAEKDYDSYGIEILVQYRSNGTLRILDRNVQSGGERAVAIATYTLALQHLSNAPFRCVDEINQGMDPQNELKILNMIIEQTQAVENNSQYFFVTPKMRVNVQFLEKCNMIFVFNGQFVPKDPLNYFSGGIPTDIVSIEDLFEKQESNVSSEMNEA